MKKTLNISIIVMLSFLAEFNYAQTPWIFTGNNPSSTDFLGTTNNQDLRFKAGPGGINRLRILQSNGYLGLGN